MKYLEGFLGSTEFQVKSNDLYVALNSYSANRDFEDWHSHKHASISFLLSGSYREEIATKGYVRRPGDIKFIAAGEDHRCNDYIQGTRKINIELPDELLKSMQVKEDDLEQLLLSYPQAKFKVLLFYHELTNQPDAAGISTQLLLYDLLYTRAQVENCSHRPPDWINKLKDLLHEQFDTPPDLTAISHILNVHPVTISRYFPKYFGVTLSAYLRNIRVEKALSLIKDTNKSLTDIGLSCGFTDQSHFTHTFKKVTGFLPKEYRSI